MKTIRSAFLLGLLAMPASAGAQTMMPRGFVAPYVGGPLSDSSTTASGAPTVGVSAGWIGSGWWGVEGDLAHTDRFFPQDGFLTERRVMTVMGNVLVSMPTRSERAIKPYGAGGFGLIRPRLSEPGGLASIDVNQPGFNVGAGVIWMKKNVGLRGDVRYFRSVGDEADDANAFGIEVSTLDFVRASVGLHVGF